MNCVCHSTQEICTQNKAGDIGCSIKKKGEELNNPRKGNQISIYPETRVYFFARETFSSGIYEVTRVSANFEIQIHF